MKILITGGAGFIGTNLVWNLVESGAYDIAVLDNFAAGQTSNPLPATVEFICGDFRDSSTVTALLRGVDIVVHLAAQPGVIDSITDPITSFETNVAGSFRLLQLVRMAGVRRFIFASTSGALMGNAKPPVSEDVAPAPTSPYGATKAAIEAYCSAFAAAYGLRCTCLRFSNVYGPHSFHKKSAVSTFVKKMMRGQPLVIYGDGSQLRDYLYVGDLVNGVRSVIENDVTGTYHLGSGKPTSVLELISLLTGIAGRYPSLEFQEKRCGEVEATWCDISRATSVLGFAPNTSLQTGLRTTWEWFQKSHAD